MDEVAAQGCRQKESHMPLPGTEESTFRHTEEQGLVQHVTSFEDWRALASAWPLKQLVAIWNDLPGVVPVQKFTNREIALERVWRSVHGSEGTGNWSRREQKNPFREGSKAAQADADTRSRSGKRREAAAGRWTRLLVELTRQIHCTSRDMI